MKHWAVQILIILYRLKTLFPDTGRVSKPWFYPGTQQATQEKITPI
jgi:hypothetical protein